MFITLFQIINNSFDFEKKLYVNNLINDAVKFLINGFDMKQSRRITIFIEFGDSAAASRFRFV